MIRTVANIVGYLLVSTFICMMATRVYLLIAVIFDLPTEYGLWVCVAAAFYGHLMFGWLIPRISLRLFVRICAG